SADSDQNDAHVWGQKIAMMSVDTDVDIAGIEAVVLSVRDGNEEGENAEHNDDEANYEKCFHGDLRLRSLTRTKQLTTEGHRDHRGKSPQRNLSPCFRANPYQAHLPELPFAPWCTSGPWVV